MGIAMKPTMAMVHFPGRLEALKLVAVQCAQLCRLLRPLQCAQLCRLLRKPPWHRAIPQPAAQRREPAALYFSHHQVQHWHKSSSTRRSSSRSRDTSRRGGGKRQRGHCEPHELLVYSSPVLPRIHKPHACQFLCCKRLGYLLVQHDENNQ